MIQLSGLTKSFGDRVLLDNVTWQVGDGDRVGLCGPERRRQDDAAADAGRTRRARSRAASSSPPGSRSAICRRTAWSTRAGRSSTKRRSAFQPLLDARAEIDRIEHALADPSLPDGEHETLLVRYHDLTEFFRREEGHSIELRVTQVLEGLGFSKADFDKPAETFSGGWQMRIALAKLLLGRPTLLLLDEPTNHLDLDARNWLEEYLVDAIRTPSSSSRTTASSSTRSSRASPRSRCARSPTTSARTRSFSSSATRGSSACARRSTSRTKKSRACARSSIGSAIRRPRPRRCRAASRCSTRSCRSKCRPNASACTSRSRPVRRAAAWCSSSSTSRKAYGDHVVLDRISLHVERGDRIALVAPNGAGKSTLMRTARRRRGARLAASAREGHQVVMQYFAQDEANRLDPTQTVYEDDGSGLAGRHGADDPQHPRRLPVLRRRHLQDAPACCPAASARGWPSRACCCGRPTRCCSTSRPTTSISTRRTCCSRRSRTSAARLIFVSHDRYFVDRLATKVIAVGHGDDRGLPGHLRAVPLEPDAAREPARRRRHRAEPPHAAGRPPPTPSKRPRNRPTATPRPAGRQAADRHDRYEEKKKADAEARRRRKATDERARRVADLEARIAEREQAIKDLEAQMAAPGFYDDRGRCRSRRQPAPSADVGGRRPDEPVGSPPEPKPTSD